MSEKEKIEANKRYNAPFMAACEYVMSRRNLKQKDMARLLNTTSSHFSDWKNGKKKVSDTKFNELIILSRSTINYYYLKGLSEHMFSADVPDDELRRLQNEEFGPNPHFVFHAPEIDEQTGNIIDIYSSLIRRVDDVLDQMKKELAEVQTVKSELRQAREDFRDATSRLTQALRMIDTSQQSVTIAADSAFEEVH